MRYEARRMPTRAGWCVFKAHDPAAPVGGVFGDEVTAARVAAIANDAYAESGADGLAEALQVYARRQYWTAPGGDGPRSAFLPAGDSIANDTVRDGWSLAEAALARRGRRTGNGTAHGR